MIGLDSFTGQYSWSRSVLKKVQVTDAYFLRTAVGTDTAHEISHVNSKSSRYFAAASRT